MLMFRSEAVIFSSALRAPASGDFSPQLYREEERKFRMLSDLVAATPSGASPLVKGEACVGCASTSTIRIHYNAPSCHGCKAFFRRSVFEGRQYVCSGDNDCDISNESRNRCRACRFRKCLEGGMNPKHVREERSKDKMQPLPSVEAMSDQEALLDKKPIIGGESQLTLFLVGLERQTEILTDEDARTQEMCEWSRDVSLTFGLHNPQLVIRRSPVSWGCLRIMSTADLYCQWYRAFVLHADWAMGIPDFRVLPIHDQTALFKQNFMAFGWITYVYHSYAQGMDEVGLPLGNGSFIPYKEEEQQRTMEAKWVNSYGIVARKLLDLIAKPMRELQMTFEEHCIVKAISLFQKDCPLSEAAHAVCNRATDRLFEALATHIEHRNPNMTPHQRTARALKCALLLPSFNHIGQIESAMIHNLTSVDICELGGVPMEILNTHRPGSRLR